MRHLTDQRGTVLLMAVVAMLIFGVMGMAFALLGTLETRIGINQKQGGQALALAEAALEHGRDRARELLGAALTFSDPSLVGNANDGSVLLTDVALGDGTYSVRIDNNCAVAVRSTLPADPGCGTHIDDPTDGRAALTAWATRGSGRARVRVWMEVSNPWGRVCYNGDGTLCTQEPLAHPNATVSPSDPDDLHGPGTGPLPVPTNLVCGDAVPRTADVVFGAGDCVIQPYYSAALNAPCPQCSPVRAGCVGHTGLPGDFCPDSGMVFYGCSGAGCTGFALLHNANILVATTGSPTFRCAGDHTGGNHPGCPGIANTPVVVYVMGKLRLGNGGEVNGTIVVHGNDVAGSTGPDVDMSISGQSGIWTLPCGGGPCGYPMALMVYDPAQSTLPQNTFANISNSNTEIHGIVYSAGEVSFNPVNMDGGVVAWKSYFQNASSAATYNDTYGKVIPPGLSMPAGSQTVAIDRRTWSQCVLYSDDSSGPTSCN